MRLFGLDAVLGVGSFMLGNDTSNLAIHGNSRLLTLSTTVLWFITHYDGCSSMPIPGTMTDIVIPLLFRVHTRGYFVGVVAIASSNSLTIMKLLLYVMLVTSRVYDCCM